MEIINLREDLVALNMFSRESQFEESSETMNFKLDYRVFLIDGGLNLLGERKIEADGDPEKIRLPLFSPLNTSSRNVISRGHS